MTPITAENFLHNQLNRHTKIDPLDTILEHIQKHTLTHTAIIITNEETNNSNLLDAPKKTISIQDDKGKQREKKDTNTVSDNKYGNDGERIIRTRCGIVKNQTDSCTK